MATVLMPLPESDFDPTEAAVSWMMLGRSGHRVRFATPAGRVARGDDMMLSGRGLDPWGFVPGLSHVVGLGRLFRADHRGRDAYAEHGALVRIPPPRCLGRGRSRRGGRPVAPRRPPGPRHAALSGEPDPVRGGGGRLWPGDAGRRGVPRSPAGGADHRPPNRPFRAPRPPHHRPHLVPRAAGVAGCPSHPFLGFRLLPDLPRTTGPAPGVHVRAAGGHSCAGPTARTSATSIHPQPTRPSKRSGRVRDNPHDDRPAFVVRDGNYLSARWPGDVHTFAKAFAEMLGD